MKVCIITSGLRPERWRLQPWRYILELARGLLSLGHSVTAISDMTSSRSVTDHIKGVEVIRIPSVKPIRLTPNPKLQAAIYGFKPDWLIWHVGLTSFIYFDIGRRFEIPSVGVFTSPIYKPIDLFRVGAIDIIKERHLTAAHLIGLFVPRQFIRKSLSSEGLLHLFTLSETTKRNLIRCGVPSRLISFVPPGVDDHWLRKIPVMKGYETRRKLGVAHGEVLVTYAGPPVSLRGVNTLIRAVGRVRSKDGNVKALLLLRHTQDEQSNEVKRIRKLIADLELQKSVFTVSGFLTSKDLKRYLDASDAIALPFHLVSSDMPLSILEALALDKTVISSPLACIPELLAEGRGILCPPKNINSLAEAIMGIANGTKRDLDFGVRREYSQSFKWTEVAERFLEYFMHGRHVSSSERR